MNEQIVVRPGDRRNAVLAAIQSARERLAIAIFRWDDAEVLDALADAARRGVRVQALLTRKVKGWQKRVETLAVMLEDVHAEVYQYARAGMKYHAKYLIADEGPALIASFNFTRDCFSRTCDFLLTTHDPSVVSGLTRLFEGDCDPNGLSRLPSDLSERLIVGPEFAREKLTGLIQHARRSIHIIDPKLNDPAIRRLLKKRHAEGVEVLVAGHGDFRDLRAHGRMMIIDGAVAVIGSVSLAPPSLDVRRELAIIVREPALVAQLAELFREVRHHPFVSAPAAPVAEDAAL